MSTIPLYQLYLLQVENYEIKRYFRLLKERGFFGSHQVLRKSLVWTSKAKAVFLVALGIHLALIALALLLFSWLGGILAILIFLPVYCLLYAIALLLLWPVDAILKHRIITAASQKLKKLPNIKIIGIAGSYGKTTMKYVLQTMLAENDQVLATPESVNTPVGIGRWILSEVSAKTKLLIIEMGEHYRGDIRELCRITPPDVMILTGINEAHLERLGNVQNTIATIFEGVEETKPNGIILLNADDENIMKNYAQYTQNRKTLFFSANNNPKSARHIQNKTFHEDGTGISFTLFPSLHGRGRGKGRELSGSHPHPGSSLGQALTSPLKGDELDIKIPFLGEYAIGTIIAGILLAQELGISSEQVQKNIAQLKPVPHRLEPIAGVNNVLVIDDSYNGNPDGVEEAIRVLGNFKNRRKIYITPGLVETGERAQAIHEMIGERLAGVADIVILIQNSVTPWIEAGLLKKGFRKENILWYETAPAAHSHLPEILQANDVILFQNDWGDNYI